MMISLTLLMAMAIPGSTHLDTNWLPNMLTSARATRCAAKHSPAAGQQKGALPVDIDEHLNTARGSGTHDGRTFDNAAFDERIETGNAVLKQTADLEDERRYEEAYYHLRLFREARPDLEVATTEAMAECATMTGRYEEAYGLLCMNLKRLESQKQDLQSNRLLAVSVAGAMLGDVFAGQFEYCANQAAEGAVQESVQQTLDLRLAGRNPARKVAIAACLALGLKHRSTPYLELAHRLDPANTVAADELISRYVVRNRDQDVRRVANIILANLPADHQERAHFEWRLANMQ